MPKARPIVASFWVYRPDEHPHAFDYPVLLRILQTSCDRLGLRHVVLTDHDTLASDRWPDGIEGWASDLPLPLMQACTTAQANYLESGPTTDVLFCGADCVFLGEPSKHLPRDADLCLSYRHALARYPINNAFMYVRQAALPQVAALYRRVADRCGTTWCDDQRSLRAALEPMPGDCGVFNRDGIRVGFVPMRRFNHLPKRVDDPATGALMLHFRGKRHSTGQTRKEMMLAWARRHGFA